MEREAALEARRNAQRSNISFAFGSSVPRNVDSLQCGDSEKINRHANNASGLLQKGKLFLYVYMSLFIFLSNVVICYFIKCNMFVKN